MLLTCQRLSWSLTLSASGSLTTFPAPAGGVASTDTTTAHVEVTGQPAASHSSQAGLAVVADGEPPTTLAPTSELRSAQVPFPGFPELVQALPAEAVPTQSEVPAASAVPTPQSLQGVPILDTHAPVPGQAMHSQSAELPPRPPQQQQGAGGTPTERRAL